MNSTDSRHEAGKPLAALLTGRELVRVGRVYSTRYATDINLSKREYNARLREIAAELYPEKVAR